MEQQDNQREAILFSYLAGIIDGEGTIRICATKKPLNHDNWNTRYSGAISLGMANQKVIKLMAKTFGSKVRIECVPNRKIIYRWGTSGNLIVPKILKKLLPYLIVKKEQAKLVIDFCEGNKTKGFKRNKKLPVEELRRREEFYQKVKKLNAAKHPQRLNEMTRESVK